MKQDIINLLVFTVALLSENSKVKFFDAIFSHPTIQKFISTLNKTPNDLHDKLNSAFLRAADKTEKFLTKDSHKKIIKELRGQIIVDAQTNFDIAEFIKKSDAYLINGCTQNDCFEIAKIFRENMDKEINNDQLLIEVKISQKLDDILQLILNIVSNTGEGSCSSKYLNKLEKYRQDSYLCFSFSIPKIEEDYLPQTFFYKRNSNQDDKGVEESFSKPEDFTLEHIEKSLNQFVGNLQGDSNQKGRRHICITGSGGQGKTTFLLMIFKELFNSKKVKVIYFSLNNLIFEEKEDLFQALKDYDKKLFLLLDGFNEISNKKLSEKFFPYIRNLSFKPNITIISTSRTINIDQLLKLQFQEIFLKELSEDQIILLLGKKGINISEQEKSILNLLSIPLYLKIYCEIKPIKSPNLDSCRTRYQLLSCRYFGLDDLKIFYDEIGRLPISMEERKNIYFMLLPTIAYTMVSLKIFNIDEEKIRNCLKNVLKCEQSNKIDDYFVQITTNLATLKKINTGSSDVYAFFHQDVRDFFAAFHIINNIKNLRLGKDFIDENIYDLSNLETDFIKFLIEGFFKVPFDECKQSYIDYFNNEFSNLIGKIQNLENKIKTFIFYSQIGYEVFRDEIKKKRSHPEYFKIINKFYIICKNLFKNSPIFSTLDLTFKKNIIFEIYSREAQLLRNNKKYNSSIDITYEMNSLQLDCPEAYHQMGKAYLYYFSYIQTENRFLDGNDSHIQLESVDDDIETYKHHLVKNGIDCLEKASENKSATALNLLGMLHSTPNPIIKDYLPPNFIDFCKAFICYYYSSISNSASQGIKAYAKFQCVTLLLKNYVALTDDIFFSFYSNQPDSEKSLNLQPLLQEIPHYIYKPNAEEPINIASLNLAEKYLNDTQRESIRYWRFFYGRLYEERDNFDLAYECYKDYGNSFLAAMSRRMLLIASKKITNFEQYINEYKELRAKCLDIIKASPPRGELEDFSLTYAYEECLNEIKKADILCEREGIKIEFSI